MDAIDRELLSALQADGRLTLTDLASRVGASLSSCQRRVRELERSGVIAGYRAVVDPSMVDLPIEVLILVEMRQEDRETLLAFEDAVRLVSAVVEAQRLFGNPDYLLRVAATSLTAYQELEDDRLAALPGVLRLTSIIVMKQVVHARGLPLDTSLRRNSAERH